MSASTAPKSARRKSRELAFQGIYEWLIAGSDAGAIEAFLHERYPTIKLDDEHFQSLLHGALADAGALDALIQPHIDRQTSELSPVEHALLLMGTFELQRHPNVPYRVVINEAVELGKVYGGTDGYKYVNGVLDRIAAVVRKTEVEAANQSHPQEPRAADDSPPPNPYANVPVSRKAKAPITSKGRAAASSPRRASASPRTPRKD